MIKIKGKINLELSLAMIKHYADITNIGGIVHT
jgi:hypothetical protein